MNNDHQELKELLRRVLPPIPNHPCQRDLWPLVHARIEESKMPNHAWDWLTVAAGCAIAAAFPQSISLLLLAL